MAGCVEVEHVLHLQNFVDAALAANLNVFPRNGFLLGLVRHGGMLPNEGVDDDLGVLDTPQLRQALTRTTRIQGKRGVSYTLTVRKAMPSWVRREGWIGLDPYTNKPID